MEIEVIRLARRYVDCAGVELAIDTLGRLHALHYADNGEDTASESTVIRSRPDLRWDDYDVLNGYGDMEIYGLPRPRSSGDVDEWEAWINSLLDPTLPAQDMPSWVALLVT